MTAIAPLSVLLVGMLGMLVLVGAVARIVVAERRLIASAVVIPLAPPAAPLLGDGIAA